MKAYVCNICGAVIADPYKANMKEFCLEISNCEPHQFAQIRRKRKVKIHLCKYCIRELKDASILERRGEQK